MFIPYVSQVGNNPKNDCGPACSLMLLRALNKAMTVTPAELSLIYDRPDDGTTTANLVALIKSFGLTPISGIGSKYPYIELVQYKLLPHKYNPTGDFLHWIVRLSDTTYHDPNWPGERGKNLTATKQQLDAAEYAATARVTIKELETLEYKARVPYDRTIHYVEASQSRADRQFVTDQAEALGHSFTFSADDAFLPIQGMKSITVYLWNIQPANRQAYIDFQKTYYNTDIPVSFVWKMTSGSPPVNNTGRGQWGVNALYSMAAAERAIALGARFVTVIDVGTGVKVLAEKYPNVIFMSRISSPKGGFPDVKWLADKLSIDQSWPSNVICLGMNEDDQMPTGSNVPGGSFKSVEWIEKRHAWDVSMAAEIKRRSTNVRYAAYVYAPICKPEEAHLMDAFKRTYVPSANAGTFYLDMHPYGRDENTLWSINSKGEKENAFYELRAAFLVQCGGLDPSKAKVVYSEMGVDKLGTGGMNQIGLTNAQVLAWITECARLHESMPYVIGGSYFQYGDSLPAPIGRGEGIHGDWWGYEMAIYDAALKSFYENSPNTPPVTPPPSDKWRVDFFANKDLSGQPVSREYFDTLSFDWKDQGPTNVPKDGFSMRADRTIVLSGQQEIIATGDDGFRVYWGDTMIISAWKDQASTRYSTVVNGDGSSKVMKVEYYESTGNASFSLQIKPWTPPVNPPGTVIKTILGTHCMTNGGTAQAAVSSGLRAVVVMDNPLLATQLAQGNPGLVVINRRFWPHGSQPTPEQVLSTLPMAPGLLYSIYNEGDNFGMSVPELEERAKRELAIAQAVNAVMNGKSLVLVGGFAMLNPNWGDPAVRAVFKKYYAPAYNAGQIAYDGHTYTPNLTDGFHKDGAGNWRHLFDPDIGFNPAIRRIYSSETGVDEPNVPAMGWLGRGGFVGQGLNQAQFNEWCRKYIDFQSQPMGNYPSPFVAGAIYQYGGNGDPQWNKFEIGGFVGGIPR